jgi:hypothetical protein
MPFTPVETSIGGYLLHLSTEAILEDTGRVFGISGIVNGAIWGGQDVWRWASILGLLLGPFLVSLGGVGSSKLGLGGVQGWQGLSTSRVLSAGLLVGFGSRVSAP